MMSSYCFISGLAAVYTEYILKKQFSVSLHRVYTLETILSKLTLYSIIIPFEAFEILLFENIIFSNQTK